MSQSQLLQGADMANTSAKEALEGFLYRYETLRSHNDSKNNLLENLIMHISGLNEQLEESAKKLDDAQLDVQDARNSRRQFQQELRSTSSQLAKLEKENTNLKKRNPYVALLIDGDGYIFQNQWVKQGLEGGRRAANTLYNAVAQLCAQDSSSTKIICSIYANIGGLVKAMVGDEVADDRFQAEEFIRGFNQALAPFDFIDAGYGKERADSKLQEMTKWHLGNINCQQILLGISHDNGYAPFLDNIFIDSQARDKVTVIEGIPTVQEILATKVEILDLETDLFRKDKLVTRVANNNSRKTALDSPAVSISPSLSNSSVVTTGNHSASYALAANSAPVAPAPRISTPLAKQFAVPPKPKSSAKKGTGSWSPGARGFDSQVKVSAHVLSAMKNRRGTEKLCNNHFVRRDCTKVNCPYVHDYAASAEEIDAIRQLSRMNPCVNGQSCDDAKCMYGHHCPSVADGVCGHPFCRFARNAHPPGTVFKNKDIDDNELPNSDWNSPARTPSEEYKTEWKW